jgi:hypothetical protein
VIVKLEIARGLFLIVALVLSAVSVQAWSEPQPQILSGLTPPSNCRVPANAYNKMRAQVRPDQDLLLVMFSLSQALKS